MRRAVWGMPYVGDAGIVSRSPTGLARMMTVIVEVFGASGLTVSKKKTETLLMRVRRRRSSRGRHQHHLYRRWRSQQPARSTTRSTSSHTWAASLPKTPTSCEISTAAPKSLGDASGSSPQSSSTGQARH